MDIGIAFTHDDEHKVHKTLSVIGTLVGSLKDDCSMEHPSVLVQITEGTMQTANYAYIEAVTDLPRIYYYFIRDKIMHRTGILELVLECDYLMTFETEIKNLICTIDRNEIEANAYIADPAYKTLAYKNIVCKEFNYEFSHNNDSIVLMTVG